MQKGNLSINSENILPIIKKWLYSDSDIFIRELVSNSTDAITKFKLAAETDEAEQFEVCVTLDKENKTIAVSDNGIGMTKEEVVKYIAEIAFSGANDFVNKYKDKANDIIGHFGLGFYSTFMVADKVEIDTLSYKEEAEPVKWLCDGGIEYELSNSDRTQRGTTITLYVSEDGEQFLEEYTLRNTLKKYCKFMPFNIYFNVVKGEQGTEEGKNEENGKGELINTYPLWLKQPSECTDEEYKSFYHETFSDFTDPLFWIHLNMDYPFKLKGILYFPKLKHELETIEGQVKLYSNQVFIADNIKEVIPEFLLLLKGTVDCQDLPLNVSRSFLQNDAYVKKLSGYITKKVADKLNSVFKKDRETYNGYWDDINPFVKYGCIKEKDFYDKVNPCIVYKTTSGDYATLDEFLERNKETSKDKIFYVTNENQQAQYIRMFKDNGMEAVILTANLDNPFISYLESYETKVKFSRIDSDISEALKQADDEASKDEKNAEDEKLENIFSNALNKKSLKVKVENLKSSSVPAIILLSEQSRRMQEMSKMFGGLKEFETEQTLVLNKNNSLVKRLLCSEDNENTNLAIEHIFDLAMLSHKTLTIEEMTKFMERSNTILEKML